MNTPNPLIPQGSLPDSRGKSHVRIAVFTILAIHVVLLGALLMAGCKKTNNTDAASNANNPPVDNTSIPPLQDSNSTPVAPPGNPVTPPANSFAQGQVTPPPSTPVAPPSLPTSPTPTPVPPPVDSGVSTATSGEHTIVKGDTFGSLAKKYNTTTKAITDANPGVQSSKLKIGQKVKIPASTGNAAVAAGTTAGGATAIGAGGETVHVVKNNDTLWGLAKKYGVSQNAIKAANGLKTGSLKVGQKLKIPAKSTGTGTATPAPAPAPGPEATPIPTPAPTGTTAQ